MNERVVNLKKGKTQRYFSQNYTCAFFDYNTEQIYLSEIQIKYIDAKDSYEVKAVEIGKK